MAEEGGEAQLQEYTLVTAAGETLKSSKDFNGKGIATYQNGDQYDGEFVNGLRCGKNGVYTYFSNAQPNEDGVVPPKEVYTGEWLNNCKHGIGLQNYIGKGTYQGYWENGEKNGEGVMKYDNGDIYSGNWKNGKKDGPGTYIFDQTKMKFIGKFAAGQMVEGKWIYPNGSYFEGQFDNNQPKGEGKWHFANGNVVGGIYRQTNKVDSAKADEIQLNWKTTSDLTEQC